MPVLPQSKNRLTMGTLNKQVPPAARLMRPLPTIMADSAFAAQLDDYGPDGCWEPPTLAESRAYCRRLAQTHYENFSVVSWMLPAELRPHFHSVYAWCRWADDLADELDDAQRSLRLLDWWGEQLQQCYAGQARHPVLIALRDTIERYAIPGEPFLDLLAAFRQDQRQNRYATRDELLDYCRHSANPVGRLVLYLGRACSDATARLSDDICTGLQLANFCQDVADDYRRGRIYLPEESWQRHGYDEAGFAERRCDSAFRGLMREQVDEAEALLRRGWPLVRLLPRALQVDVDVIVRGGLAIVRAIRRQDYDVWARRPRVSRWTQAGLLLTALWHACRRRAPVP